MNEDGQELAHLSQSDVSLLRRVEAGLPITADISRADLLLCALSSDNQVVVVSHGAPQSISSLYRQNAAGRTFTSEEQPEIFRVLQSGSRGRYHKEILSNTAAPVIQDVFPVRNQSGLVIAALVVETNMIAHERQRRRVWAFRNAVPLLIDMCVHGELVGAETLTRFGLYDGVYLVDQTRNVIYMSGIASNMFRTIGLPASLHGQPLSSLEETDVALVERAFETATCLEMRTESNDGRTWIRSAIPLSVAARLWSLGSLPLPLEMWLRPKRERTVSQVFVLLHNATEAVAKQRELNVKAAIIQEVHHRVKNNLQNIAAILRIQARRCESEEAKQHLTDAVNRVLSMSVIHEFLSQADNRSINVRDVCQRIANQVGQVSRNPEQEIEIRVSGPNVRLPASQATPAAMVVNELLLNALEHGMKDRGQGLIHIRLTDLGDAVRLDVEDNGGGLPPDFDPKQSRSLGLQIVHTLVTDDLKGSLVFTSIAPDAQETISGASHQSASQGTVSQDDRVAVMSAGSHSEKEHSANSDGRDSGGAVQTGTQATVIFPKRPLQVD